MKKLKATVLAAVMTVSCLTGVTAVSAAEKPITVSCNGATLEFDQEPVIQDGRTKVPFRKIFESMGAIVYYSNSKNSILALTKTGDIITHTIGTNTACLNGAEKTFDSNSAVLNGRTVVPVRMVSELLGADVEWIESKRSVVIEKDEEIIDSTRREIMNRVTDINFNPKDVNRYVDYKKKNPQLSAEQAIIDVNMDLDRELVKIEYDGSNLLLKGLYHYGAKKEDIETIENPNDIFAYSNRFNKYADDYIPMDLVHVNDYLNLEDDHSNTGLTKEFYSNIMLRKDAALGYLNLFNAAINEFKTVIDEQYIGTTKDGTSYDARNTLLCSLQVTTGYTEKKEIQTLIDLSPFSSLKSYGLETPWDKQFAFSLCYDYYGDADTCRLRSGLALQIPNANSNSILLDWQKEHELTEEQKNLVSNSQYLRENNLVYIIPDWMYDNCYKYGFCQLQTSANEKFNRLLPWAGYITYVGEDVAMQMHNENLCFDEYYAKYLNPTVNSNSYSLDADSARNVIINY